MLESTPVSTAKVWPARVAVQASTRRALLSGVTAVSTASYNATAMRVDVTMWLTNPGSVAYNANATAADPLYTVYCGAAGGGSSVPGGVPVGNATVLCSLRYTSVDGGVRHGQVAFVPVMVTYWDPAAPAVTGFAGVSLV
jgi:hypothetical protein